jgi:hypothetical protein
VRRVLVTLRLPSAVPVLAAARGPSEKEDSTDRAMTAGRTQPA